ncbi:MAG: SGNH/GDSL hydrolase family protein [Mycobacterium sp.]|nr:SGNH/GDSL hydrolase family protein [Mycobacterium sp.]
MLALPTAAALGPLLLVQGLHVRRVTPRLPEAPGPRSGRAGVGAPLRLLVAGDSAAAGVGAASQDEALVGRLVAMLAARRALDWQLEARTGYTTADAHRHLAALPADRFDVVVLSLGVNDVTRGVGRGRWLARQAALADLLQAHFEPRVLLFTALPPMHLFPALPQPLRWYLGLRARDFNIALAQWTERRPGCHVVAPDFQADPAHIASDGFHPGPAAYSAWAARLARDIDRLFPADPTEPPDPDAQSAIGAPVTPEPDS